MKFEPRPNAKLACGVAIRVSANEERYLRITHAFRNCYYGIWVTSAAAARSARRPARLTRDQVQTIVKKGVTGRLELPEELTRPLSAADTSALQATYQLIAPLIKSFGSEENLRQDNFSRLIALRADQSGQSKTTLLRLVKRLYYFGGDVRGLLSLLPGPEPTEGGYRSTDDRPPKRRGRKSVLEAELGPNDFVVQEVDVLDMIDCVKRLLRKGPTFLTHAHEHYLANAFRKRHPEKYEAYLAGRALEPVTVRQFRQYIRDRANFEPDLAKNLRGKKVHKQQDAALQCVGPGELFEIDATGGRIHLISQAKPHVLLGKPTIYFVVDRWSRFIPGVYITTRSASFVEVSHALLVALGSRERFKRLSINVDDRVWPPVDPPAAFCCDRGSEFLSHSFEVAVARTLRRELVVLPPYCPDGKAIVERLIRELKRRMAAKGLKGSYAERPLNPKARKAYRAARTVAAHSLVEIYRILIDIVIDHNTRPHRTLRRYKVLSAAGVAPVPQDAYLWGLKNITGIDASPLSSKDLQMLLLETDKVTAKDGVLHYRGYIYEPRNATSRRVAALWSKNSRQVEVRVDKSDPHDLHLWSNQQWTAFARRKGQELGIGPLTAEDVELTAPIATHLNAKSEYTSRIGRLKKAQPPSSPKVKSVAVSAQKQRELRAQEAAVVKSQLGSQRTHTHAKTQSEGAKPARAPSWQQREQNELARQMKSIRDLRSKR